MRYYKFMATTFSVCSLTFLGMTLMYQKEAHTAQSRLSDMQAAKFAPVKADKTLARALYNNNPLNIKALKTGKWQGQVGIDPIGHAKFANMEYGLRAAAIVLKNYSKKHGIDTITGIVERFAESNQKEYVAFLCKKLDVKPKEKIDIIKRLPEILRAMSRFESGQKLPERLFLAYDVMGNL